MAEDFSCIESPKAYLEPMIAEFNIQSFEGGVTGANDADTGEAFREYVELFKDAWEELGKN